MLAIILRNVQEQSSEVALTPSLSLEQRFRTVKQRLKTSGAE